MRSRGRALAARQTVTRWMTFRRPRRRSYLILAVAVAVMAMTAAGAFNYRPSAFPMMFEPLPVVPCHAYWEFLRSPALEGLLTKEQRTLADLFCPTA